MDKYVEQYIHIRDTLMNKLHSMMDVYMTGMWDPLMRHIIIKEIQAIIVRDLSREFPDFPVSYLPHIKIRVSEEIHFI